VSSLQTSEPLDRLHRNAYHLNVTSLVNWVEAHYVDFSPPYQRQAVWGVRRRRRLIMSLMRQLAVGGITVNKRGPGFGTGMQSPVYAVIDGKQRWQTLMMFMTDGLLVPRSWWETNELTEAYEETEDGPYVRFSQLSQRGQWRFEGLAIPFDEVHLPSLEAEKEVFRLLNTGGLAQGEEDDDR
jgi:hypothetical protein